MATDDLTQAEAYLNHFSPDLLEPENVDDTRAWQIEAPLTPLGGEPKDTISRFTLGFDHPAEADSGLVRIEFYRQVPRGDQCITEARSVSFPASLLLDLIQRKPASPEVAQEFRELARAYVEENDRRFGNSNG